MCVVFLHASEYDDALKAYHQGGYMKAFSLFFSLAKEGDAKAQYNVAMMYENAQGVTKDTIEARKWYEKAAQQGNAQAQYNLGYIYAKEAKKGNPHGYEKAKYWYEKAAKGGVKEAYNNLASFYLYGITVPKSETKALALLEKGAQANDSRAQVNSAKLYAWGDEVQHNKLKAYEYLKKALKAGEGEAGEYLDRLCKESAWVCQNQ